MKAPILVSGNSNKVREFSEILGIALDSRDLDIDEIQELDADKVALKKAEEAYSQLQQPVIVEDSSLAIEAWKGLPGALIVWFTKQTVGVDGFLNMLKEEINRKAEVKISIGYCDEAGAKVFSATTKGSITQEQRGENGWEWDRIFQPEGFAKTYAEMLPEEKNQVSTRKEALEKLKRFLNEKA